MSIYSMEMPHPVLVEVTQTAPNQILMTYDQRADFVSATNVSNYWIRGNAGATGIASVSMGDALSAANSLRPDMAVINPVDNSGMRYSLTCRSSAMTGVAYIVLPCFVSLAGMTGFGGANWGPFSRNVFIGM